MTIMVSRLILSKMREYLNSYWWEPEACPYPDGNKEYILNPNDKYISNTRKMCDHNIWPLHKGRHDQFLLESGTEHILKPLRLQIEAYLNDQMHRSYCPTGFIYPPVMEQDEWGYVNGSRGKRVFDYIVEDKGTVYKLQPSYRPVLLLKFASIKNELNHCGQYVEDTGPHGIAFNWLELQAFETLFDIIVIDPLRDLVLHWKRQDDGYISRFAQCIKPNEKLYIKSIGHSIELSTVLFQYRYYLLGDIVPVKVILNSKGFRIGAMIPSRNMGKLIMDPTYLSRLLYSCEVEEISKEQFNINCSVFYSTS